MASLLSQISLPRAGVVDDNERHTKLAWQEILTLPWCLEFQYPAMKT